MAIIPWPKEIQEQLIGECRQCLAIIAKTIEYGRAPGKIDATLCECCDVRENGYAD